MEDTLFALSFIGKMISVFLGGVLFFSCYTIAWKRTLFELDDLEGKKLKQDIYGGNCKLDIGNILAVLFVALHITVAIGYLIWSWLY